MVCKSVHLLKLHGNVQGSARNWIHQDGGYLDDFYDNLSFLRNNFTFMERGKHL